MSVKPFKLDKVSREDTTMWQKKKKKKNLTHRGLTTFPCS